MMAAERFDRALILNVLDGDPLLTPAEVAAATGLSQAQIRGRARSGRLPRIGLPGQVYRWRASAVAAFLASGDHALPQRCAGCGARGTAPCQSWCGSAPRTAGSA